MEVMETDHGFSSQPAGENFLAICVLNYGFVARVFPLVGSFLYILYFPNSTHQEFVEHGDFEGNDSLRLGVVAMDSLHS